VNFSSNTWARIRAIWTIAQPFNYIKASHAETIIDGGTAMMIGAAVSPAV